MRVQLLAKASTERASSRTRLRFELLDDLRAFIPLCRLHVLVPYRFGMSPPPSVLKIATFTAFYVVSRATKVKAFLLGACMKHVILALAVVAQLTDLIFEEAHLSSLYHPEMNARSTVIPGIEITYMGPD